MAIIKRFWVIFLLVGSLYLFVCAGTFAQYAVFMVSDLYKPLAQDGNFQEDDLGSLYSFSGDRLDNLITSLKLQKSKQPFLGDIVLLSNSLSNLIPIINWETNKLAQQHEKLIRISSALHDVLVQYKRVEMKYFSDVQGKQESEKMFNLLSDGDEIQRLCNTIEEFNVQISKQHELYGFSLSGMYSRKFFFDNLSRVNDISHISLEACRLGVIALSLFPVIETYQELYLSIENGDGEINIPTSLYRDLYIMNQKALLLENRILKMKEINGVAYVPEELFRVIESGSESFYTTTMLLMNMYPYVKDVSITGESPLVKMKSLAAVLESYEVDIFRVIDNWYLFSKNIFRHDDISDIQSVDNQINSLTNILEIIKNLTHLATYYDEISGSDIESKYLVIGHSSDELRATGGFVSAVWVITVRYGEIAEVSYYDVVELDALDKVGKYPPAPKELEEHMGAWVWFMRDVSWDPDFGQTAKFAVEMFRLSNDIPIDGVIGVNQWALLRISESFKSNTKNLKLNADLSSVISALESGTDQEGRSYTNLVMQSIIEELNAIDNIDTAIDTLTAFQDALDSKDMLIQFRNEAVQDIINYFGWGGHINYSSGDYLFVVDSNVGWSKSDRNIQRITEYTVDLRDIRNPKANLRLIYENHSGESAAPCEPQWIDRGDDYNQLKNACYWNFLRVYGPAGSKMNNLPYLPLPEQSLSVVKGEGLPGANTSTFDVAFPFSIFSGLDVIDTGDKSNIDMTYLLPSDIFKTKGSCYLYDLDIIKQPGVPQRDTIVKIYIPKDFTVENLKEGQSLGNDMLLFKTPLNNDVAFSFELCSE